MILRTTLHALWVVLLTGVSVNAQHAGVVLDTTLNRTAEAYALAFRTTTTGVEAWLTIATDTTGDQRLMARSMFQKDGFAPVEIVRHPAVNVPDSRYNGVPTFNPCNPDEAVFVSDRSSAGQSRRSNDLYWAVRTNGDWTVKRMAANSSAWDDTPAFGADGQTLYFASDRLRPGSGSADLFLMHRSGEGWSDPQLLPIINGSASHEASPSTSSDGYLYYSSNRDGDQDIYRVRLGVDGMPSQQPERITIEGVNLPGSDEYHPVITPGGRWLVFSSNRGSNPSRPFRLYYVQLPDTTRRSLSLTVTARTRVRDVTKLQFFGELDSIYNVATQVRWVDMSTGTESMLQAQSGRVDVSLGTVSIDGPWHDTRIRTYVAQARPHQEGFQATTDTLVIDVVNCSGNLNHTLYLDDTTTAKQSCDFTFRTFNVPFFITAYWCPTTSAYRQYTPCTSLFTDDLPCEVLQQPEHCESNEAFTYEFVPAKLIRRSRAAENCVNYDEFLRNGPTWAHDVDRAIERMRDEVGAALNEPCIQEAIRRGYMVDVTYVGTTDDRTINYKCTYTGKAYEEIQSLAPDIHIDTAIVPFITPGRKFNAGGYGGRAGGNQLLSDLRSLYFAILFDNLCKATVPQYAALRARKQMTVRSRGQAIDTRDLPYEFKRAAGVEVRVPDFEIISKGRTGTPSRTVVLCPSTSCP